MKKLTYKSSLQDRIWSGLALILSCLVVAFFVIIQAGKPVSLPMLFITLALLFVTGNFAFYLLRFSFCPILQIYKNEIIISRFSRMSIPLALINRLSVKRGMVEIAYRREGQLRTASVPVWDEVKKRRW